jgi:uncharacterized RDD family membrane protein YckC
MTYPGPAGGPPGDESNPPPTYGAPTPPPSNYGTPPPPPPTYGAPPPGNYPPPSYGQSYGPPGGAPGMPPNAVGQPGSLVDRFVARFIDGLIVGVIGIILNIVLGFISNSWILTGLISAVLTAALYLGYFAYFESTRGQTVGKQVMKLRTFGPDHVSNPTLEQAVRRNIFTAFSIAGVIPLVGGLIGWLAGVAAVILIVVGINSDPHRQHWFDKFAGGTQVIKIG